MRTEAEKAAPHEHYPAPDALINLWERYGGDKAAMDKPAADIDDAEPGSPPPALRSI